VGLAPLNEFGIQIRAAYGGRPEVFPVAQHAPTPAPEVQDGSAFLDRPSTRGQQLAHSMCAKLTAMKK